MKTTQVGRQAEERVATELQNQGYEIIERNWRTKSCEIDIIAKRGSTIYFIEVKYRRSADFGDGFSAITQKKLHQMRFAAKLWAHLHASETPMQLLVANVIGDDQTAVELIELQ